MKGYETYEKSIDEESRSTRFYQSKFNLCFWASYALAMSTLLAFGTARFLRSPSTATEICPIRLWGYLSPYRRIDYYPGVPQDCDVEQVNILHRHGERFPELSDQKEIVQALDKYQKSKSYHAPELKFLDTYSYDLEVESLVRLGAEQSWMSGATAFERYANLFDQDNLPFLRVSVSDRVIMTARNWSEGTLDLSARRLDIDVCMAGFSDASRHEYRPEISVYLDEGANSNNTLYNNNCPEADNAQMQLDTWVETFASSTADRLNSLVGGIQENITAKDAFHIMMMCPYETIYRRVCSPFCRMFTEKEFEGFEYALDVEQYYKTGYGQKEDLGRLQGVGYVNELLARLTDKPVEDDTQTNRTLDNNPETFPLKRKMYVDFSHDHAMTAIYSALGLFDGKTLDPTKLRRDRTWVASVILPFSGRMAVERLHCSSGNGLYGLRSRGQKRKRREGIYVRILVNDILQPLQFCGGDQDGLCSDTLDAPSQPSHKVRTAVPASLESENGSGAGSSDHTERKKLIQDPSAVSPPKTPKYMPMVISQTITLSILPTLPWSFNYSPPPVIHISSNQAEILDNLPHPDLWFILAGLGFEVDKPASESDLYGS
ncbi:hypothetical protein NP233_g3140 [Leucocoprinus birnbaumii]|uniref:Acid phosphatase n=1 Tax=Leucocoprinus birnbaumii TaxID=56174 RepID=A0AAD5VX02_9AGAR|nr:hypothetical protein NP233_g3140 [Leucocoprinus birnbaumii]